MKKRQALKYRNAPGCNSEIEKNLLTHIYTAAGGMME